MRTRNAARRAQSPIRRTLAAAYSMILTAMLAACSLGGERAPEIEPWIMDYEPPGPPTGSARVDASLEVDRFAGMTPCGDTAMSLLPEPHRVESLPYSRWLSSPASQVGDLLERDLASAGIFDAVFGPLSGGHARFRLLGTVEACSLEKLATGWRARLAVRVALIDTSSRGPSGRLVLQRLVSREEPAAEPTAKAMASALSTAMADLSESVVAEVGDAARGAVSAASGDRTGS